MSKKSDQISTDAESHPTAQLEQHKTHKKGYYAIFMTIIPLLLHALSVTATACFVRVYLAGHVFDIKNRDRIEALKEAVGDTTHLYLGSFSRWAPLQTDVITLLSVLIVITRFFLTVWCADVALKYVLILLERTGLSIFQIRQLIKYKVLLLSGLPADLRRRGLRLDHIIVALVLFLPFPAHLSSPVITGSITWTPSLEYVEGAPLGDVPMFTNGLGWTRYQQSGYDRAEAIVNANILNNVFYSSARPSPMMRSLNPSTIRKFPPNSTVSNILIPYISISNLTWITDISQIPPQQMAAVSLNTSLLGVNASDGFSYKGSMALLPDEPWKQANTTGNGSYADPREKIISQRFYLAFWPRFTLPDNNGSIPCSDSQYDKPKIPIPSTVAWHHTSTKDPKSAELCIIFATVDVLAGQKICPECQIAQYNSNQTVVFPTDLQLLERVPLKPDILAQDVIWMMPGVTDKMMYSAVPLPTDGGLENYVTTMLTRTYVVSWNALTEFTWDGTSSLSTGGVKIALQTTRAVLNEVRLIVWIVCQCLVWVVAGIFAIVESRCKHSLTTEPLMSIIFMDKDEEVRATILDTGLSDAVDIHPVRHNAALGVLKLNVNTTTGHSQIVRWSSLSRSGYVSDPISDT